MSQEEVSWLIKSGGRILGPFTKTKVVELLRTREISVLDEISAPQRRWHTIQYHENFKEVVDSLRKANLSEKTEATWTPTGVTSNLTQTLTDASQNGDLTEELTDDHAGFSSNTKEIVIHDVQEQSNALNNLSSGRFQSTIGQNTAVQRQADKTARGLWVFTALVMILAVGFIVQKRMGHGGVDHSGVQSTRQLVVSDVQVGEYAEALRQLKTAFPDPMLSGDLAIYYGSLLIQVEGQTVMGRRLLNSVVTGQHSDIKQAYTGLGIADLIDGQLEGASSNFNHALALDADYVPAIVDSALLEIQRSDYLKAKSLAGKALALNPGQGEAVLAMAEAQLFLHKSAPNWTELQHVGRTLHDFRARQWDFAAEIGLYSMYFDFLRQDKAFADNLREYLDLDPRMTMDHRHNVFIYHNENQWKILGRLCEQMADKMGDDPKAFTMMASCYAHEQRWDLARKKIETAVDRSPRDPLVQAWYSYILRESGEPNQASVALSRASDLDRHGEFALPILLQGRFCAANGDVACAQESWQRLEQRNLDDLSTISGMAWVNAQKGFHGEANKLIERGLKISPDYRPLLMLRQKAEREGWHAAN